MENILDVKNLSVTFDTFAGKVEAIRDVSFQIKAGECVAVVGESGCGKSATAKAILGLHTKKTTKIGEESSIFFGKQDILKFSDKEWKEFRGNKAAMIFQDALSALNPTVKIGTQIAEAILLHQEINRKDAMNKAVGMLEAVGVTNPEQSAKMYPFEFSGGMRQRAMIAMAMACNPKLLIADEPTTALDVTMQTQILQLIKKQQKEHDTAVLFITHDLGIVAGIAQKVIVMYNGKIVEQGTVDEIFYHCEHPYTKALMKSSLRVDLDREKQELYSIEGMPPSLINPVKGCPFATRCPDAMNVCVQYPPQIYEETETHCMYCWKNWKR